MVNRTEMEEIPKIIVGKKKTEKLMGRPRFLYCLGRQNAKK